MFIKTLKAQENFIEDFDDSLWNTLAEKIVVGTQDVKVLFKDGTEITV